MRVYLDKAPCKMRWRTFAFLQVKGKKSALHVEIINKIENKVNRFSFKLSHFGEKRSQKYFFEDILLWFEKDECQNL